VVADLVVAGAGPQALSLCCQLLQKRPRWRHRLRVLDPAGRWLSRWERQMQQLEIALLRSPSPHHPHPNPNALRSYAQLNQRSGQLEGPYGQPQTGLFNTFCQQVVEDFGLASAVEPLALDTISLGTDAREPLQLGFSDGTQQQARHLVIATGPNASVLPSWWRELPLGAIPRMALQHSQDVDLRAAGHLQDQTSLIVGGGLTSAHLSLGAIKRGAKVQLLVRRQLRSKLFDADPG
jgi:lysine/ornithine N-monooxygenase